MINTLAIEKISKTTLPYISIEMLSIITGWVLFRYRPEFILVFALFGFFLWLVFIKNRHDIAIIFILGCQIVIDDFLGGTVYIAGNFRVGFSEVLLLVLFFAWFSFRATNHRSDYLHDAPRALYIFWLLYILSLFISALYTGNLVEEVRSWLTYAVEAFLIFHLTLNCVKGEKNLRKFLFAFILVAFFIALTTLAATFFNVGLAITKFTKVYYSGFFGTHSFLSKFGLQLPYRSIFRWGETAGALYGTAIIISAVMFRQVKRAWLKFVLILFIAVIAVALFVGFSRSTYVGFICGMGILLILIKRKPLWTFSISLIFFLVLTLSGYYSFLIYKQETTYKGPPFIAQFTSAERLYIFRTTLRMVPDIPFFGLGFNRNVYYELYPQYASYSSSYYGRGIVIQPHNSYLQFIVNSGFPGLILFGVMVFIFLKITIPSLKKTSDGFSGSMLMAIFAALIFLLTQAIFDSTLWTRTPIFIFWILIGAGLAINRNLKIKEEAG